MEPRTPDPQVPPPAIRKLRTELSTVRVARLRRRRVWGRRVVGVSAGTGVLFALTLLALSPFALGSGLGVVLKPSYSGTVNDGLYPPSVGPGVCLGSNNSVFTTPTFVLKTGHASAGLTSTASPCTSYVAEFAGVTGYFGMNTSAFTPAASAVNDHINIRWSLDYTINLATTFNAKLNSSSYAYAGVQLDGWLIDVSTSTTTSATSIYQNYSYLSLPAGSVVFTVGPKTVVETVVANLTAGNTYVIETVLTCQTGALVRGVVGSSSGVPPSAFASSYLAFPGTRAGTGTVLKSISY
jgi:hypothetical protein